MCSRDGPTPGPTRRTAPRVGAWHARARCRVCDTLTVQEQDACSPPQCSSGAPTLSSGRRRPPVKPGHSGWALHLLSCSHNVRSDSPLHCVCAGVRGDEHGSMGALTGHDTAPQVSPFFEESEEFFQCHDYEKHRHHGAGSPRVRFLNTGRFATCPWGPRTLTAELWGNAHSGT